MAPIEALFAQKLLEEIQAQEEILRRGQQPPGAVRHADAPLAVKRQLAKAAKKHSITQTAIVLTALKLTLEGPALRDRADPGRARPGRRRVATRQVARALPVGVY
jgi:hypothetical protein